jgi:hypothetical protein
MHASRFVLAVLASALLVGAVGCKTTKAGKLPVAAPGATQVFVPPDRDDVFPDEDTSGDDGETEGEGDDASTGT